MLDHTNKDNFLDPVQFAYRFGHSNETVLLRFHNDSVSAINKGYGIFLILLNLPAAFDMVDDEILRSFYKFTMALMAQFSNPLRRIFERAFNVYLLGGWGFYMALVNWLMVFLKDWSLGRLHFAFILFFFVQSITTQYHSYANDTHLYCFFDPNSPDEVFCAISACISDTKIWIVGGRIGAVYL